MIALDTNILVYAHRPADPLHARASAALERLSASGAWGLPWPVVHEFLATVTSPSRMHGNPTPVAVAFDEVARVVGEGGAVLLGETSNHLGVLRDLAEPSGATGPRFHDARIAAICLAHGVRELWSADRDFSLFPALRARNPLAG